MMNEFHRKIVEDVVSCRYIFFHLFFPLSLSLSQLDTLMI